MQRDWRGSCAEGCALGGPIYSSLPRVQVSKVEFTLSVPVMWQCDQNQILWRFHTFKQAVDPYWLLSGLTACLTSIRIKHFSQIRIRIGIQAERELLKTNFFFISRSVLKSHGFWKTKPLFVITFEINCFWKLFCSDLENFLMSDSVKNRTVSANPL
jgi:hypothetical protein